MDKNYAIIELGVFVAHCFDNWEVQGSIPGMGKPLTPGFELISDLMMYFSDRKVFSLLTMKKLSKMFNGWITEKISPKIATELL